MGHQLSTNSGNSHQPISHSQAKVPQSRLPSKHKTIFHYIQPLKCEHEDELLDDTLTFDEGIQNPHEAEYWQIENNQEQSQYETFQSAQEIEQIEEIKVKWNTFIKMKKRNYLQDYAVLKEIGRGGFGCVHKVKARYTGIYRAAKRIKKAQLKKSEYQKLFEEMAIMISLDHPNIAKLYEVYDYKSYYVLILELCEGGQLFKKIVTKQMTEQSSAIAMKQILRTLIYLHKQGIVHRDLKPENMMFEADSDMIKMIDFGIAVKKKPDQILTSRLGTPYYIAPEVLCKSYGEKCDVWSAGVILFMMIAGYPPFRGETEFEVMENVLKDPVAFKGTAWARVSQECRSLVAWMLKKNPDERPNAFQAFEHPWIAKIADKPADTVENKEDKILANIRNFGFQNKLQAVVYTYIVSQLLSSAEKKILFETFKQLDTNNDGVIESSQLRQALKNKKDVDEERLSFLMRVIDTNSSGHIDYTEFLVAGINAKDCLTQKHFEQAFQYFDIDHSGEITFEEIAHFLEDSKSSEESIKKIFCEIDENNDGNISKEEFVKLLMKETKRKMQSLTNGHQEKENVPKSKKSIQSKKRVDTPTKINPSSNEAKSIASSPDAESLKRKILEEKKNSGGSKPQQNNQLTQGPKTRRQQKQKSTLKDKTVSKENPKQKKVVIKV